MTAVKCLRADIITLIVLIAVSIFCKSSYAETFFAQSENEFSVFSEELGLNIFAIDNIGVLEVTLYLNQKEIVVKQGYGANSNITYVKGVSIYTGDIAFLSDDDYHALMSILTDIQEGEPDGLLIEDDLIQMIIDTLELLLNWPAKRPLFVSMNDSEVFAKETATKTFHISRAEFDLKRATNPKPKTDRVTAQYVGQSTPLCSTIGKIHSGSYKVAVKKGVNKTVSFKKTVGGSGCFGRCGIGCGTARYTQNCFNHDGCGHYTGYIAGPCNAMWTFCIPDFFRAPICNKAK